MLRTDIHLIWINTSVCLFSVKCLVKISPKNSGPSHGGGGGGEKEMGAMEDGEDEEDGKMMKRRG